MPDLSSIESFDLFADDLMAERSVRPLVIVGASKVDHLLSEMLRIFLLPKIAKPREPDELLDGDAPLATFSARIRICRRLGLVDETLYLALQRLRALRNVSAHSLTFDSGKSPVREHLTELRKYIAGRRSYRWTKQRYFEESDFQFIDELQCLLLTFCVLLEAMRTKVARTSGSKRALSIAVK